MYCSVENTSDEVTVTFHKDNIYFVYIEMVVYTQYNGADMDGQIKNVLHVINIYQYRKHTYIFQIKSHS